MYIFGRHFELETDHEPLEYIYSQKSKPFACIEHWVLCLQAYDLKVIYKLGRTNIADVLSRLNCRVPVVKDNTMTMFAVKLRIALFVL